MRSGLRKLCWPILRFFETDEEPKNYKKSHRIILNSVGALFLLLSLGAAAAAGSSDGTGAFIPAVVFFCVGFVSVVVGTLGSDRAVSKIWGNR